MTILDEILAHKATEVASARAARPADSLRAGRQGLAPHRPFEAALRPRAGAGPRIIAEVKRRSPSKGPIKEGADPAAVARAYEAGGAAAVSVLTDTRYFGGSLDDLVAVRAAMALPVLRKDFIIDPYQLAESAAVGADAILLIARALPGERLARLLAEARALGLEALVEVHDAAEMAAAAAAGASLIGINNRDLATFTVDPGLTVRLAPLAPVGSLVVSESGIVDPEDLVALAAAGASAFLVGEALMRSGDPAGAVRRLTGEDRRRELPGEPGSPPRGGSVRAR